MVEGPRVALRPLREDEREAASGWLEKGMELPEEALAIVRREGGATVGMVGYRVDVPAQGWLKVGSVALEEGWRGWGLGSEAVRLLEEAIAGTGRSWTGVPREMGLAFYFWLRLGYRPARPDEAPWQAAQWRDIMAVVRERDLKART